MSFLGGPTFKKKKKKKLTDFKIIVSISWLTRPFFGESHTMRICRKIATTRPICRKKQESKAGFTRTTRTLWPFQGSCTTQLLIGIFLLRLQWPKCARLLDFFPIWIWMMYMLTLKSSAYRCWDEVFLVSRITKTIDFKFNWHSLHRCL